MLPSTDFSRPAPTGPSRLHPLLVAAAILLNAVLFNAVCAGLLILLQDGHENSYLTTLILAQSIALITFASWSLIARRVKLSRLIHSLVVAALLVGIPAGWVLGTAVAGSETLNTLHEIFDQWPRITAGVAVCLAACMYFFWSSERMARIRADLIALEAAGETARQQAEQQTLAAQLKALQAQIEPHFLFNTLANLRSLISIDQSRAQWLLDQLNDWLRTVLHASRRDECTLQEEFDLLQRYLHIQSVRLGSRLQFSCALPENLSSLKLPPLLVQPLVENCIRHGIEPMIQGGWIGLSAFEETDHVVISIADSGVGLQPKIEKENAHQSVGLENIRARLKLRYADGASLQLLQRPEGGVLALIRIPKEP